jgi:hypothetical protein
MEPVSSSWTLYRVSPPTPEGCRLTLWLLPNGSGFLWDVLDSAERLIKRSLHPYETPGGALRAGTVWLEAHKGDL